MIEPLSRRLAAPALVVALALAGCAPTPQVAGAPASATPANVQHLSVDQVDTWRGVHYDGLILDVRTAGEWDDDLSHLDNAVLVPVEDLEARLGEFERYKGMAVLVYDRTGTRTPRASQLLVTHGFRDVSAMDGGLKAYRDWQKQP